MISDFASCGDFLSKDPCRICYYMHLAFCLYGCRLASALVYTVPKYIY